MPNLIYREKLISFTGIGPHSGLPRLTVPIYLMLHKHINTRYCTLDIFRYDLYCIDSQQAVCDASRWCFHQSSSTFGLLGSLC
jgi:hypothetical protein